jgi:hypothetical protein
MTGAPGYLPYEPQLIPKTWAEDIWTVEGPEVAYSLWGLTIPCPTRMTIIRLPSGDLWVHSPVACTPALVTAVKALGPVAAIIAPNVFHYTHLADWTHAFPQAAVFGVAGLGTKVPGIAFAVLDEHLPQSWCEVSASRLAHAHRHRPHAELRGRTDPQPAGPGGDANGRSHWAERQAFDRDQDRRPAPPRGSIRRGATDAGLAAFKRYPCAWSVLSIKCCRGDRARVCHQRLGKPINTTR